MSSRTGNVVLAEWLLDEAEKRVAGIMRDREIKNREEIVKKVANAAVKYSILKTGVSNDIVFDFNESVSLSGDSGPYLLYIVARINSILRKGKRGLGKGIVKEVTSYKLQVTVRIQPAEKSLLLDLMEFEDVVKDAAEEKDPSVVAKYLFGLAQSFNNFYQSCPVLEAEPAAQVFRLRLVKKVKEVMEEGLELLGIETVESM